MGTRYRANKLRRHYIKEWLKELGISQKKLADLMDTDKANVTRWIDEPERVNMDVLSGVADALLPFAPELADAGNLLRHPNLVRSLEDLRRSAQSIVDALPAARRN